MGVFTVLAIAWLSAGEKYSITNATPEFIRRFTLDAVPQRAEMTIASTGFHELYVNGEKAGDEVLCPVTCQPDVRVSSVCRDITALLKAGENEISVLTGNGTWSVNTEGWGFENAAWHSVAWRMGPMIFGSLKLDGEVAFATDENWTCRDSRVTFSQWRYGEHYDAARPDAPERPVTPLLYGPPMEISPEDAPPCRVFERHEPVKTLVLADGATLYEFPHNVSGWCEIKVSGERGAKVTIDYDESLDGSGGLKGYINCFNLSRVYKNHRDIYVLAGGADETWHPRFAYHGFKYALVAIEGKAEIKSISQCFVHSGIARTGAIETDSEPFVRFQDAAVRSWFSNFVGIPTDCPHREQNGWTGDAQLAAETGLWCFDSAEGYRHFLRMMLDSQYPNGAVPCVLPHSDSFGFGWGSGPAWDALLFEIPRCLYRYRGDLETARDAYPAMKRYLGFIETKVGRDGLIGYGLGDWCPVDESHKPDVRFTDTAYLYWFNREAAKWAELFGEEDDAARFGKRAGEIKSAFNREFYRGDGVYGNGLMTCQAAPLYFKGLCADGEETKVAGRLCEAVRAGGHKVDYGILGGKWVLRALSDFGFAGDAWKILVQKEYPGYQFWFEGGEDTLWENWDGGSSHNHVMYADPLAWAFEYVAGIVPVGPGFRKVAFRPAFVEGVGRFAASVETPHGTVRAGWIRDGNGDVRFEYEVPEGVEVVAAP